MDGSQWSDIQWYHLYAEAHRESDVLTPNMSVRIGGQGTTAHPMLAVKFRCSSWQKSDSVASKKFSAVTGKEERGWSTHVARW